MVKARPVHLKFACAYGSPGDLSKGRFQLRKYIRFLGLPINYHALGGLKQQKFSLTVWRVGIWNQDVGWVVWWLLQALVENLLHASPLAMASLSCRCIIPTSASNFLLCMSSSLKDTRMYDSISRFFSWYHLQRSLSQIRLLSEVRGDHIFCRGHNFTHYRRPGEGVRLHFQ